MSKYNEYAKKLDAAFKAAAEKQKEARQALEDAKAAEDAAGDPLKKQVATAQRKEAQEKLYKTQRAVWNEFRNTRDQLGRDFKAAVQKAQLADPDDLDANAVALLNSGVMTAADLGEMANRYTGNTTMLRLIGGKAKEMRDALADDNTEKGRNARIQLIGVEQSCDSAGAALETWDNLVTVSEHFSGENHAAASPELIESLNDHWNDPATQETIKNF